MNKKPTLKHVAGMFFITMLALGLIGLTCVGIVNTRDRTSAEKKAFDSLRKAPSKPYYWQSNDYTIPVVIHFSNPKLLFKNLKYVEPKWIVKREFHLVNGDTLAVFERIVSQRLIFWDSLSVKERVWFMGHNTTVLP
jgi:hypothetical protein